MTSAFQTSRSEKQSIETQFATIFKELEAHKKDNATLKERNEKATTLESKYKQNYTELQFVYFLRVTFIPWICRGEFENQKCLTNQKNKEIELLKQQCADTGSSLMWVHWYFVFSSCSSTIPSTFLHGPNPVYGSNQKFGSKNIGLHNNNDQSTPRYHVVAN